MPRGEQRAVVLDPLPERGDAVRVALLEVGDRLDDGAGEPEDVDCFWPDAARGMELTDQLLAVQVLDGADDLGQVDPIDVDDLRLHGALDGVGQALDGRDRLLARTRHVALERDRLAEGDQHAAAERLADLEGQSDGNEGERDAPAGPGDLSPRLVVERDPRGAGLDALDAALGVGGALRIDREHAPVFERLTGRGERRRSAIGGPGRVLAPVHRDGAGAREQGAEQPIAEQGRVGEEVNLSREDSRHEEGIDQVVGMVHAEEDRPGRGHARDGADRNLAKEEPDPEARQEPQRGVETARGLSVLAHGWASVSRG